MSRNDGFIQQLESYLDDYEGPTPLPETVRHAVRAAVPRTKQTGPARGPVRYLTMTLNRMAPVALAVAAALLVVAVGAFLLAGRDVGGPEDGGPSVPASQMPASPSSEETAGPAASAEEACTATKATVAARGTIEVDWCAVRVSGGNVSLPFRMEAPADWIDRWFGEVESLWLRPASGGAIAFVLHEGPSVDEVAAEIGGRTEYSIENQASVTLGGADGVVFDVSLAPGTSSGDAPPLLETTHQNWMLQPGSVSRVWIVEKDGETVVVVTGENLADAVGEALSTIEWGS